MYQDSHQKTSKRVRPEAKATFAPSIARRYSACFKLVFWLKPHHTFRLPRTIPVASWNVLLFYSGVTARDLHPAS